MKLKGRRRPDQLVGNFPDGEIERGDYWKVIGENGPIKSDDPQNLTGTVWMVVGPVPGISCGQLVHHTVREHEDGTISVRPNDGSSNSILLYGSHGKTWHGYIDHGVWEEC